MPSSRLLFVCSGNICRSPMAESLARALAPEIGASIEARSASTLLFDGEEAHELAVAAMLEKGIDIRKHRASPAVEPLLSWADRILCLAPSHVAFLARHHPLLLPRVELLGRFEGVDAIADPITAATIEAFRECRDVIERCVRKLLERIRG